jgi:hypothetical protein
LNDFTGSLDPEFCPVFEITKDALEADCKGAVPQIVCSCCSLCCTQGGEDCDVLPLPPTMAPVSSMSDAEAMARFAELIGMLTAISGASVFQDETTPQYQTAYWMAANDPANLDFALNSFEIVKERYIVSLLYFSTSGEDWRKDEEFLSETDVCQWGGVYCDSTTLLVDGLDLSRNDLDGTLPAEIASISGLSRMTMQNNLLQGNIPTQFGELTMMTELDFSQNLLEGNIPSEIGGMTNLLDLQLQKNALDGPIPSEVGMLSVLGAIDVSSNQLSGPVPSEVGGMTRLSSLSFGRNNLDGQIPPAIVSIIDIEYIGLESNQFGGSIPLGFSILTALEDLLVCKSLPG